MKIEGFQADEINVQLCKNRALNVTGERKNKRPEEDEKKITRKYFGRMFWIPDGCRKEGIFANARMEDSILNLTIVITKGEEPTLTDLEETREIVIQSM